MKKLLIVLFIVLFVAPIVCANEFEFELINDAAISNTTKILKADNTLKVFIIGYAAGISYQEISILSDLVRRARNSYTDLGINRNRITLGFVLGNGTLWKKYNFGKDGVYVKLGRKNKK